MHKNKSQKCKPKKDKMDQNELKNEKSLANPKKT